jgi:MoxR-like ATPase
MQKIQLLKNEVKKIVVGHDKLIDSMIIALLCDGHILVEGVPGVAKTTAINALSHALGLNFSRVQFTPDLLPSDITGTQIYNQKDQSFEVKKGPAFTNLLLADEINRAPAKVQSALLEVMQERQVTIGDQSFKLDLPFLVMATQNPLEHEGAYRLPEAQLDRFMLKVDVSYNTFEEELLIVNRIARDDFDFSIIDQVLNKEDLLAIKRELKDVHIDEELTRYMLQIVFESRKPNRYLEYGASPRASIDLFKASRAHAYLRGKDFVTPLDVAQVAQDILRHRIILSYEAHSSDIQSNQIIKDIVGSIKVP